MRKCTRCNILEDVIMSIWWMARRYADGRRSYAVSLYNDSFNKAKKAGMKFDHPDITAQPLPSFYAKDGDPIMEKAYNENI